MENGAKSIAERESVLKAEEQRMDQLAEDIRKRKEEIDALDKDMRYKEIHLATLEEEIKDCPYCSAKDGFVTTMRAIAEAKALGADTSDAERLFKQARAALDSSSYEGAVQYARKAMILAREAKQKYLVYGVSYILSGAERAVRTAAQMGVDVSEAEGYLRSARESHDKKDYEAAESLAKRAERVAILAEDKVRELCGKLERTSKKLEEIKSYGVDLSEAEAEVQAAQALMKDRKQAEARARLEGLEEMAFLSFRREATRLLDEARDTIAAGRTDGVDLTDAEMFFAKAEERLAEGDYGKCIQCAREASRLSGEARAASAGAPQEGASAETVSRRARSRPRILAATARSSTSEPASSPMVIITPGAVPSPQAGPDSSAGNTAAPAMAVAGGPAIVTPAVNGVYPAQGPDAASPPPGIGVPQMPAGAPLRIIAAQQAGNPTQREYECPNCQNRFIVEDPRRPLAAKCPRCGAMMRLP
jgi:DNA-directed RNA polymerase subunit RPC12/RpoP/tetratricopeptide (TPR) repeat protein